MKKKKTGFVWKKIYSLPLNKSDHKIENLLGSVENIVGKQENAGHQHFLLFPQCF